jgi:glycosyltransferase involved in cell wall biosynthesis
VRIVFVSWRDLSHPQAGGSEIVIDRLATGVAAAGHEAALLAGGPVCARSYPVIDLGGTYAQYLRAPLVHRTFRSWDLLVDVSNGLPYFAPLWRQGACLCFVHHVHTDQWHQRFSAPVAHVLQTMERRVVPRVYRANLFVAVSESTAAALEETGVDRRRIRVVHNGVDLHPLVEGEAPDPLFVVLTRLVSHKRVDLILRAWERVRPRTGGRLVVAGDGPERQRLEALAGPHVEFHGRIAEAEKHELLRQAWALVHAAHHEGWGMVILEAAAVGTPAIALDAPGVRDAIASGVTGWLARTEDELVEAWVALTRADAMRHRLGAAAYARARDLTWERTVEGFLRVAEEAVSLSGGRSRQGEEQPVGTARSV